MCRSTGPTIGCDAMSSRCGSRRRKFRQARRSERDRRRRSRVQRPRGDGSQVARRGRRHVARADGARAAFGESADGRDQRHGAGRDSFDALCRSTAGLGDARAPRRVRCPTERREAALLARRFSAGTYGQHHQPRNHVPDAGPHDLRSGRCLGTGARRQPARIAAAGHAHSHQRQTARERGSAVGEPSPQRARAANGSPMGRCR